MYVHTGRIVVKFSFLNHSCESRRQLNNSNYWTHFIIFFSVGTLFCMRIHDFREKIIHHSLNIVKKLI